MSFLGKSNKGEKGTASHTTTKYHTTSICPHCGKDINQPPTTDDIQTKLSDLENAQGLNAWEEEFVTSLVDQYTKKKFLSAKQIEILGRIHSEKC